MNRPLGFTKRDLESDLTEVNNAVDNGHLFSVPDRRKAMNSIRALRLKLDELEVRLKHPEMYR